MSFGETDSSLASAATGHNWNLLQILAAFSFTKVFPESTPVPTGEFTSPWWDPRKVKRQPSDMNQPSAQKTWINETVFTRMKWIWDVFMSLIRLVVIGVTHSTYTQNLRFLQTWRDITSGGWEIWGSFTKVFCPPCVSFPWFPALRLSDRAAVPSQRLNRRRARSLAGTTPDFLCSILIFLKCFVTFLLFLSHFLSFVRASEETTFLPLPLRNWTNCAFWFDYFSFFSSSFALQPFCLKITLEEVYDVEMSTCMLGILTGD